MLFSNDYKHFYCRYSDPSYVKKLKLEMLTAVANETNTYEIGKLHNFFLLLAVVHCARDHSTAFVVTPIRYIFFFAW